MSKKFLRLLSVHIAVMIIALLLAGCGSSGNNNSVSSSKVESTAETQPAVSTAAVEQLNPVTIKMYFPQDPRTSTKEVWDAIGAYTKEKLNASFEMNFIGWGDYQSKINVMVASGDNFDMCYDAAWWGFSTNSNKGAYLPLNDLLPKYAPKLYKRLQDQNVLSSATMNGDILCIPFLMKANQNRMYFSWRSDLADKAGLKIDPATIKTIEDVDKIYTEAKKVIKGVSLSRVGSNATTTNNSVMQLLYLKYGYINVGIADMVAKVDDPTLKLIPVEQTEAFKEMGKWMKKWVDEGIIAKDEMVNKADPGVDWNNGKIMFGLANHEWKNVDYSKIFTDPSFKSGYSENTLYMDKISVNRSPLDNLICINKNAANPERDVMFNELVHEDENLWDKVIYGIKDETYVVKDDGSIDFPAGMNATNSTYQGWAGQWGFWDPIFMKPDATHPIGFWQREVDFADQTGNIDNPINGLSFNTDAIKNEVAKRNQIFSDTGKLIVYGLIKDSDKAVEEYIEKQKSANLDDKILPELQKQVDAFLASKR